MVQTDMNTVFLRIDDQHVTSSLEKADKNLDGDCGDVFLDFSSVRRVDVAELRALEKLASDADQKKLKVVLRGVNVDFYKALKLAKLAGRFTFVS